MSKHTLNTILFSIIIIALTFFFFDDRSLWVYILVTCIVFGLIISSGVIFMKFNYFLTSKTKLNSTQVLLTFDDGPDKTYTPKILEILKKNNISALFFVIGSKAEQHPEILQQIVSDNHLIGNHTYSHHPLFSMRNQAYIENEMNKCEAIISKFTRQSTFLFRPPIGYTNPIIARVINTKSFQSIGWTLRSYDSVFKNPKRLKKRLVSKIKNGQIILLHDNLPQTAEMLEEFILEAQKNGIIFANHSTILNEFK